MVHSFNSHRKADGEKTAVGVVGLKGGANGKSSTGITTAPTGDTGFNEQQIARSGSGGSDCLFSRSTEELMDLDLGSRSDLQRQTASYHNNNIHNATLGNNFSIDDQQQDEEAAKSYSHQHWSSHPHSHPSFSDSCCCFPLNSTSSNTWKQVLRPRNIPILCDRLLKMALKKYYLILFCLTFVIASCLVASLVISRRVGDLDGDGDSIRSASLSRSQAIVGEELEVRNVDLVDLVESGKTFAFAKYRVQVRVPKSKPNYEQHPSFLLDTHSELDQAASSLRPVELSREDKYYLTSMKESSEQANELAHRLVGGEQLKRIAGSSPSTTTASSELLNPREPNNLLGLEIKPVNVAKSNKNDAATPGIEDIAALLAMTTTGERRTEGLGPVGESHRIKSRANKYDLMDPVEQAASELHLKANSLNKTLLDCFLVDTDKRYEQKVLMEDTHRQVASTRQVSSARMMALIADCRRLTWASLPNQIKIKAIPGEQPLVPAGSADSPIISLDDSSSVLGVSSKPAQQPHDIIGNLFGSWLHYGLESTAAPAEPPEESTLALESRLRPQPVLSQMQQQQRDQKQQRQASFLNMGISMVNGIIPNTLWCGLGDRAANYSELGAEYKVDACCRAHDHCPVRLKPFTTDYGLVNWSMSTRSHCECDIDFNDCLNAVNSTLSNVIKVLYFRFVGLQCIDVEKYQADSNPLTRITQATNR